MDDYISREAAMSMPLANGQYDHEHANEHFILGLETYKEWLEQVPAADVRPVVPGEWIAIDIYKGMGNYKCSVCNQESYVPECMGEPMYNFCPNCGAKMGGTQ